MNNQIDKTIIIDWVRHAESCANYDQGTINDNIPKNYEKNCGYQMTSPKHILQEKKQSKELLGLTTYTSAFKYEPNLSFIGMQHAIMLGMNFVENQMNILPYDMVFVSPMTRTIMTALLAFRHFPNIKIYVIPFISEHLNIASKLNNDYQNTPVNSYDLKKRIIFIKDWLETNWLEYYDDIEVITILEYIREKIPVLKQTNQINSQQYDIIFKEIMETLQCRPINYTKKNECSRKIYNDTIKKNILCNTKHVINSLISNMNIFDADIKNKINKLKELLDPNVIRGPQVDFSIIEKFENQDLHSNFDNFYDKILPLFFNNIINNKILCVAHGSVMKEYFNKKYESFFDQNKIPKIKDLANTQVLEEKIKISLEDETVYGLSLNPSKYLPISIRKTFQNFEYLNYDVCRTESIKGIINYYMTKNFEESYKNKNVNSKVPQDDTLLVPAKSSYTGVRWAMGYTSKDYVNPDAKFYYDKKWNDYIPKNDQVKGGYYDKYLKYKQKYLQLKNNYNH